MFMDRDNFIAHVKTSDIYKTNFRRCWKIFGTSSYEIGRSLPKGENKEAVDLVKDELGWEIMKEIVGLRWKTCSYLRENNDEQNIIKGTKTCVLKRKFKFQSYKECLKSSQIINTVNYLEMIEINVGILKEDKKEFIKNKLLLKLQQRFNSERHNIFTKEIRKIAMISNDDKRMPSINSLETIQYGMRRDIMWKKEKKSKLIL